jgi:hypothetical protein
MRLQPRRSALLLATLAALGAPALRAQVTETPKTIEPGGLLMRMDAISLGIDPDTTAPNQYKLLALGTTILSAGLTDSWDVEFGTQLYLRNTFTTGGSDHTESGIGDFDIRTKWTFWRDPSSGQAAAIVPYVKLPTHSSAIGNNSVEGGVILPWSMDIAAGSKAGAMFEWDEFRNISNTRYDTRWYGSAFVKWELGSTIGAYGEVTLSDSTAGTNTATGTLGAGATLSINKSFLWDLEANRVIGTGRSGWSEVLRFRWKIL